MNSSTPTHNNNLPSPSSSSIIHSSPQHHHHQQQQQQQQNNLVFRNRPNIPFSKWEDPYLTKLAQIKKDYLNRDSKMSSYLLVTSVLIFFCFNIPSLRNGLISLTFQVHTWLYQLFGNFICLVLFIVAFIYRPSSTPLPKVALTRKQVELLGWPLSYPNTSIIEDEQKATLYPIDNLTNELQQSDTLSTPNKNITTPPIYTPSPVKFSYSSPSQNMPVTSQARQSPIPISTHPPTYSTPSPLRTTSPPRSQNLHELVQRRLIGHSPQRFISMTEPDLSEQKLDKFLETAIKQEQNQIRSLAPQNQPDTASPNRFESPFRSSATPQAYQPAYRSSPKAEPTPSDIEKNNNNSSSSNLESAEYLLKKLKIEPFIDAWAVGIRRWISTYIVKEVANLIDAVNKLGFEKMPSGTDLSSSTTLHTHHVFNTPPHTPTTPIYSTPQNSPGHSTPSPFAGALYLFNQYNLKNMYSNQLSDLTMYLDVRSMSHEYTMHRIKELAADSFMRCFNWSAGGSFKGKEWSPGYPTDAQIVIHLFNTFFDLRLPTRNTTPYYVSNINVNNPSSNVDHKPFSKLHFVVYSDSQNPLKHSEVGKIVIFESQLSPPHFDLAINGKEVWHVFEGRNNLWYALVLFAYYIRKYYNNYLGPLDVSNLTTVLEPWQKE